MQRPVGGNVLQRERQAYHELRPLAHPSAVRGDGATVEFNQSLHQRQPEAQAALAPVKRGTSLRKWLEQPRQHLRRHADTGVRNTNSRLIRLGVSGDGYPRAATWPGELGCVLQKITDRLCQPVPVSVDKHRLSGKMAFEAHLVPFELGAMVIHRTPHQLVEIQALPLQRELVARDPGRVEEIIDQVRELPDHPSESQ